MSKIYYEKRRHGYECTEVKSSDRDSVEVIFDEPFDADMRIGAAFSHIVRGVGTINIADLSNGEYEPRLYREKAIYSLGKILLSDGGVSKKCYDEDELKRLREENEDFLLRLCAIEKELSAIKEKIFGNPIF